MNDPIRHVLGYRQLARLFEFYAAYCIAHFDDAAATRFDERRRAKLCVGTSDLKIAAVALTSRAIVDCYTA